MLLVAKNTGELHKWLTTDKKARSSDKLDKCRIGYVGFTRAKQVLCLACLQPVDKAMLDQLTSLSVRVIGSMLTEDESPHQPSLF